MFILSQNGERLRDCKNLYIIKGEKNNHIKDNDGQFSSIEMGRYNTYERCKEVLMDIIAKEFNCSNGYVYVMPQE